MPSFVGLVDFPGNPVLVAIVIVMSLVLPLAAFFGQTVVGSRRIAMIEYLDARANDIDPQSREFMQHQLRFAGLRYSSTKRPLLMRALAYLLPTLLFVVLSALGFWALIALVSMKAFEAPNFFLFGMQPYDSADFAGYQAGTALVISAGFLGAYIWSINYLVLRVANYDLSPLSFLRAAGHMLLTIFAACVLRHVLAFGPDSTMAAIAAPIVLGAVFLTGFFPNLGLGILVSRMPDWIRLKRPVSQAAEIARDFPLELIDGITPTIRFRLESFDVTDVHNLAVVDPLILYLESPYGHLEVLDWIGQAQLLACVGPEKFLECRKANIRDIHGLLALGRDSEARALVKDILVGPDASNALLTRLIASYADTLHVQRLEHWGRAITGLMRGGRSAGDSVAVFEDKKAA